MSNDTLSNKYAFNVIILFLGCILSIYVIIVCSYELNHICHGCILKRVNVTNIINTNTDDTGCNCLAIGTYYSSGKIYKCNILDVVPSSCSIYNCNDIQLHSIQKVYITNMQCMTMSYISSRTYLDINGLILGSLFFILCLIGVCANVCVCVNRLEFTSVEHRDNDDLRGISHDISCDISCDNNISCNNLSHNPMHCDTDKV